MLVSGEAQSISYFCRKKVGLVFQGGGSCGGRPDGSLTVVNPLEKRTLV
jgi:hypothetical protein